MSTSGEHWFRGKPREDLKQLLVIVHEFAQ
jgi:hypothetical protein